MRAPAYAEPGTHRASPPSWPLRALAVVIALTVGVAGGIVASASATPVVPAGDPSALGAAVAEAATPDLAPLGDPSADLLAELRAVLPTPEPVPANAYEATPKVVHGTLEIPSIGLTHTFYEGVTLTAINRGPSHWPGTAMPGELGNVVIAGHRTTYSRPFWDLDLVQPGDELIFSMADGTRHVYVSTGTEVVDATAIHIVDQAVGHTATLFACHPKGSARQRIVGHFELAETTLPS